MRRCRLAVFCAVNIPLRLAFVKELFDENSFASINAILEIENQVAAASGLRPGFLAGDGGRRSGHGVEQGWVGVEVA